MTAKLTKIDPGRERAKFLRREMNRAMGMAFDSLGSSLSGYALIAWDGRGEPWTGMNCQQGPVSRRLLPSYAQDTFSRLVTLAEQTPTVKRFDE